LNKLTLTPMTIEYAKQAAPWKYEGEYSFYDHDGNTEEFMDGTYYACLDEDGKLVGDFCFGKGAQISTVEGYVFDDDFLDIGLALRPDLCGKGMGLAFFNAGLDFARKEFGTGKFRLSVAAFNERAVKVYERAGFCVECEVTNSHYMNKFYVMKTD